jgi:hypothetical protein
MLLCEMSLTMLRHEGGESKRLASGLYSWRHRLSLLAWQAILLDLRLLKFPLSLLEFQHCMALTANFEGVYLGHISMGKYGVRL